MLWGIVKRPESLSLPQDEVSGSKDASSARRTLSSESIHNWSNRVGE